MKVQPREKNLKVPVVQSQRQHQGGILAPSGCILTQAIPSFDGRPTLQTCSFNEVKLKDPFKFIVNFLVIK